MREIAPELLEIHGTSFQYRPYPQMTVNFAPLFGVTEASPTAQVWFNAGGEF